MGRAGCCRGSDFTVVGKSLTEKVALEQRFARGKGVSKYVSQEYSTENEREVQRLSGANVPDERPVWYSS